jgi:hypothetical protein
MAETRTFDVKGFPEKRIITLGGRQKKYLRVAYDKGVLPIVPDRHPLSRLYLEEAHRMDHAGVDAMVMRSRSQVWITQARLRTCAVKRACFTCKRRAKKLGEQKMAPLPEHRMGPTPPFWSTVVDLFGPLSISGSMNKLHREGMGSHLRVHINIPGSHEDSGDILHGVLLDGCEEINGFARCAKEVPVRPGDSAGHSL